MTTGPPGLTPGSAAWALLATAGDEALLPAGVRIVTGTRPGRQCFLLIEGAAVLERADAPAAELGAGAFVGAVDQAGRPAPPTGIAVRLVARSRVLVIDAGRLAALVDADPAAAAAWAALARAAARDSA